MENVAGGVKDDNTDDKNILKDAPEIRGAPGIRLRHIIITGAMFLCMLAAQLGATFGKIAILGYINKLGSVDYFGFIAVHTFVFVSVYVFLCRTRADIIIDSNKFCAGGAVLTLTYCGCIYAAIISPYLMPLGLVGLLIAPLIDSKASFAAVNCFTLMILVELVTEMFLFDMSVYDVLTLATISITGGTLFSFFVAANPKRIQYLLKGLAIGLVSVPLLLICNALQTRDYSAFVRGLPYVAAAVIGQVALAFAARPLFEGIFNLVTDSRLTELIDHNNPLMKRLSEEAPGTFNHCLSVANFAVLCAKAIGENIYLARAAAYYHDIGKLKNPQYFKENQRPDYNPHDELLPEVSYAIIKEHTAEGLRLCKRYRIPKEISHVAAEHHGTLPIAVFYNKAKSYTDGAVDAADFSYAGDKPSTKIAAIIMISDSCEAAVRAIEKPDGEKVDAVVNAIIKDRVDKGQFDGCPITLNDLYVIRRTIVDAFGGIFHKRVKYPEGK